jgi:hypothetical protein
VAGGNRAWRGGGQTFIGMKVAPSMGPGCLLACSSLRRQNSWLVLSVAHGGLEHMKQTTRSNATARQQLEGMAIWHTMRSWRRKSTSEIPNSSVQRQTQR